jgi:hypothetical protein
MKDFLFGLFVLMGMTVFCTIMTCQWLKDMGAW